MDSPQSQPPRLPSGNVTFLFTDIVGSTEAWETHGDAYLPVLQAHNAIIADAVSRYGGYIMKTEGDAFKVVFSDPAEAAKCAIVAQAALHRYPWPNDVGPLRVRMGLHTGDPILHARDYFGPPVNRAARILSSAHGGQILMSEETLNRIEHRMEAGTRFQDLGYHKLKDLGGTRLFQLDHPALESRNFPPPSTLNSHPNNLPIQRTSFVGREKQIEQIAALLGREGTSLLKLTGEAGIGKTRLALQAGAELIDLFPDKVWYVRLAAACDAHTAAQEVADQLGIEIPRGAPPLETVRAWLAEKQCLLILDDCGHLPQADRLIRELLTGASSLRCLAISRETLEVGGDELRVPELSLPVENAGVGELLATESGLLFAERAWQSRPDFELNDRRAGLISRILNQSTRGVPGPIQRVAGMLGNRTVSEVYQAARREIREAGHHAAAKGREIISRLRDSPELSALLTSIGGDAGGDLVEAEMLEREHLAERRSAGDGAGMAASLRRLGNLAYARRDFGRSVVLLSAALQAATDAGSPEVTSTSVDLAMARRALGLESVPAAVNLEQAYELALSVEP